MLKIFTAEADKYHEVCARQVMIPPNAPFCWESDPPHLHFTHGCLGSPRVDIPNGISVGSAVFAWLTLLTNRL